MNKIAVSLKFFGIVGVLALLNSSAATACSDCETNFQTGAMTSARGCCCSCTSGGRTELSAKANCEDNQAAKCSCTETSASASCTTNTNQGISAGSLFHNFDIESGNTLMVAAHMKSIDGGWTFVLASGFGGGTPATKHYSWNSGVNFETALDDVAADYGACADVDWTYHRVTFRGAGNCS